MAKEKPQTDEAELSPEFRKNSFMRTDALRILDIHADTLDRWRRRGLAPPETTLPGRQIVFPQEAFFAWAKEPKQTRRARRGR